jgi:hypothetical protein
MSRYITITLALDLRAALKKAAVAQTRSLSAQVSHYIKEGLARDGVAVEKVEKK